MSQHQLTAQGIYFDYCLPAADENNLDSFYSLINTKAYDDEVSVTSLVTLVTGSVGMLDVPRLNFYFIRSSQRISPHTVQKSNADTVKSRENQLSIWENVYIVQTFNITDISLEMISLYAPRT